MQKRAYFGGSFDPVHGGHLALATAVRELAKIDDFFFLPAAVPPHKTSQAITPAKLRLEMLNLAVANDQSLHVDDRELRRQGPSYTVDTMTEVREEHPQDMIYFVIGMDSLRDLPTWYGIAELTKLVTFLVCGRPGIANDLATATADHLPKLRYEILATPAWDISSTAIRAKLAANEEVGGMLPPLVAAYIAKSGLYRLPPS